MRLLNGRSAGLFFRNVARPSNYVALARSFTVYDHPIDSLGRYFLGRGTFPCEMGVKTPTGPLTVTAYSSHDAITVHEVFCRGDYRSPVPPQLVVDIGSNIGVSALYFLTRSPTARCVLFEPDPRNVERLHANLAGLEDRVVLHERAVGERPGEQTFWRESTGRYGTLDATSWVARATAVAPETDRAPVAVKVEGINDVLERALEDVRTIDLVKIDTEGTEARIVRAIDPLLLRRVRRIVIESTESSVSLDGFTRSRQCDTITFRNAALRD